MRTYAYNEPTIAWPWLEWTMQHQCSEQERAGGTGSDTESPLAALLSMLEAARVALVELSAHVVFVELVDLVREALLQVEDLADYAEHGGEVTVIAMEAEDIAVARVDADRAGSSAIDVRNIAQQHAAIGNAR